MCTTKYWISGFLRAIEQCDGNIEAAMERMKRYEKYSTNGKTIDVSDATIHCKL